MAASAVAEVEGTFVVSGASLYSKTWSPPPSVKLVARLIFVHGFSDHVGRYYGLFPHLASCGIEVCAWDQRGWGRSVHKPSDKGLTGPTSRVTADIAAFIAERISPDGGGVPVPLFVMGHSMGGGEVATLASDPAREDLVRQVRGWLLESPFIAFSPDQEPPAIKVFLGKLAGKLLPHFQLVEKIAPEKLSRDPAVVESLRNDKLCHDTGTLEGLAGLLERTENLDKGRVSLSKHVKKLWLGHGSKDMVTNQPRSRAWFDRETGAVEDATYKLYEGCYHQLHSDLCKDEFYKDVSDWILARCKDKPEAKAVEAVEATEAAEAAVASEGAQPKVDVAKL